MATKSTGSTSAAAAMVPDGSSGGWVRQKIDNDVFQTRQIHVFHFRIQCLNIEFGNESQMVLLLRNGGGNARQRSHKQFAGLFTIERLDLHKNGKMPDCCMFSQKFTIKPGVTRFRVGQYSGKETKWSPMVPRFLVHDATDMSIGGIIIQFPYFTLQYLSLMLKLI
jgi:hypothetical protein